MGYRIIWSKAAERQLKKLDLNLARQVYRKVGHLSDEPYKTAKKLVGSRGYRIRMGDYRVIYDVDDQTISILILKVGHRSNIYK